MSNIIVTPTIVDDIEFYLTNDGKEAGVSISGLARLVGIPRRTLSYLVNNLNDPGNFDCPKRLEPLLHNVFTLATESSNGARIIQSDAVVRIIEYYAFEAAAANEIAKDSFRKFARLGFVVWVKHITGYVEKAIKPTNAELLAAFQQLVSEVKETKEITRQYKELRNATVTIIPGVDRMLDDYKELDLLNTLPTLNGNISLHQWINITHGCTLDNPTMHKFAHLVSGAYKSATGKEPVKSRVVKSIDKTTGRKKYQNNTCVYSEEEFPILEMAWNKLMCS